MMLALAIWCLVTPMCYALPLLDVAFSQKAQESSITCRIQEQNLNSDQEKTYEVYGYVILKSNQSHWTTMAEIFRTNPTFVHVNAPRIALAEGSFMDIGQIGTQLKITWNSAETSMSGNYRCDAILKNNSFKVENKDLPFHLYRSLNHDERNVSFLKLSNFTIVTPDQSYYNRDAANSKENTELGIYNNLKYLDATNKVLMKRPWHETTTPKDKFMKREVSRTIGTNASFKVFQQGEIISKKLREKRSSDSHTEGRNSTDNGENVSRGEFHSAEESIMNYVRDIQQNIISEDQNFTAEAKNAFNLKNMTDNIHKIKKNTLRALNLIFQFHYYKHMYNEKKIAHLETKLQTLLNYSEGISSLSNIPNMIYSSVDNSLQGSYALLKPSSGCPNQFAQKWQEGYMKIDTESSSGTNNNSHSENIHLAFPVKLVINNRRFINLSFCIKDTRNEREQQWPKGSYCISKRKDCPDGFDNGTLWIDTEDDGDFYNEIDGVILVGIGLVAVNFCCRRDARPTQSIGLPFFSPFYLYRFQGRCQEVIGMSSTEEFVYIDSENSDNNDKKVFPHPDGEVNNVNITLCYYKPLM